MKDSTVQRLLPFVIVACVMFATGAGIAANSETPADRVVELLELDPGTLEEIAGVAVDCSAPGVSCFGQDADGNGCAAEDEYRRSDGACVHVDQIGK